MKKKKVLIDVNSIVPYYVSGKVNGIGRTTRELVTALDEVAQDLPFEIQLFSQNMKGIGAKNLGTEFKSHHLYLPHRQKFDNLAAKLRLRELLTGYDFMHIPHNYEIVAHPERCIVTIHDAMFFSYPEEAFSPEFCRKYYTAFAQKCKAIITCSESSKRDIVKYMGVPEDKVNVCHWGVDHKVFYPRAKSQNKYCANEPYFISSSCDKGRKNTISIIRAFAKYRAEEKAKHHLILVWRQPPQEIIDEIESLGIKDFVHFASNISDEELANLYASATACFFPSIYEGFGLPILESMASATPVVTCDNSSLGEVGADAAIYVEPYDIDAMAHQMSVLENDTDLRGRLSEMSVRQAAKFTWANCANKTIDVYRKCLNL